MVLSEIRSNPRLRGITSGFADAASAALALLRAISPVAAGEIVWVAHHGRFSHYEDISPESFTRVDLAWDGERYHGSYADQHLLSRTETDDLLRGLELAPVPDALEEIGHTF